MQPNPRHQPGVEQRLQFGATPGFVDWLRDAPGSVAITTYQAGKLVLVGWDGEKPSILPRQFSRPMGLAVAGGNLAIACRDEIVRLVNVPELAPTFTDRLVGKPYDALYLPRISYHTNRLNVHDLAFGTEGLWFVNTLFNCLALASAEYAFVPRWKPWFVSAWVPEDRCHLNGVALVDGKPRYVTCLGATDTAGAWRAEKATGGLLIDIETNTVLRAGLAMPHSPRFVDGRLWFLNSGCGELCRYDFTTGTHEVICALPGYPRGLSVFGTTALVGLSRIREKHLFGNLPVQQRFEKLHCGVAVIDTARGVLLGMLEFTGGATELYEVCFLANQRRPMVIAREAEASRQAFPTPGAAFWAALPPDGPTG